MSKETPSKPEIKIEDYGSSISNPILVKSIRAGYIFCDKLKNLDDELEYSRRGSNQLPGFDKPVDAYDFTRSGKDFCTVYIYAYHSENIEEVPKPMLDLLNEDISLEDIWEDLEITEEGDDDTEELFESIMVEELDNPPPHEELFESLVRSILNKQNSESWTRDDENWLKFQMEELTMSPLLEPLVLEEWELYLAKTHRPHREFFIQSFLRSYHHSQLEPYLPQEAMEKNELVKEAYLNLVEVINRIQFFADEEVQERIAWELGENRETRSGIKQCNTKFCALRLHSDFSGSCNIDYWLDQDILDMLYEKPVSTLLRSINELTPGLEERVSCRSLTFNCESWFKDLLKEAKYGEEYSLILAGDPDLAL